MSFSSSASSTLVPTNPKYPTINPNAVGYETTLVLNTSAAPRSQVSVDAFTPITLATGIWSLSGILTFGGSSGNFSEIQAIVNVDNTPIQSYYNYQASGNLSQLTISAIIRSNDNNQLSLPIEATISGQGSTYSLVGTSFSSLKLVRLA
jgi:hypothetical protein